MAIVFPYDLLADFPGWSPVFRILRREEQSRAAGGQTFTKDFGDPLWQATYASKVMSANALDAWRARIDVLDGAQQEFLAYKLSRCAPIAYPNHSWPTSNGFDGNNAVLASVAVTRKIIGLSGLGGGHELKTGDMLRLGDHSLHEVVTGGVASGAGSLGNIEVRPHLWPETIAGDAVSVVNPYCHMTIVPGSIQADADFSTGRGSIRFDAVESR